MLLCGEIHYFRVPRILWRDRLLKLKRMGANCVSTYIPWNWHMPRRDIVDFRDEVYEWSTPSYFSKRLREYLELAKQLDLKTIIRPGPYICAEWDNGGHPAWLHRETRYLRSLDEVYIKHTVDWYRVVLSTVIEYIENNTIPVIQVENEYFWGNKPFIERLYREIREYSDRVLVVVNENPYLDDVVNTIDDYPAPWNIESFDEKTKRYVNTQPGLPKIFMELGGGWFTSTRYGLTPTNRLSIPPEWSELLVKTAFFMGVDNINIYMFHGGSNPGYYTGKYITSSYDYEAAVREWGELSKRYYVLKRIYMVLNTLSHILEKTRPMDNVVEKTSTCSDIYARTSDQGAFVLLRNMGDFPCYQKLIYRDEILPREISIEIQPRYAKIIPLDLAIPPSPFIIKYSTLEALLGVNLDEHRSIVVFYGRPGEEAEIEISSVGEIVNIYVYGDVDIRSRNQSHILRLRIKHGDDLVILENNNGYRLILVFTSRDRAERTWYIDEHGVKLIIIGRLYYIGEVEKEDNSFRLNLELDRESCGNILLISSKSIEEIELSNQEISFEEIYSGIYKLYVNPETCIARNGVNIITRSVDIAVDPVEYDYFEIKPYTPLESMGFTENGLYVYKIIFDLEKPLNELYDKTLAVVGVYDYVVVDLNNVNTGSGYHLVEVDTGNLLRKGRNELSLIVESTGHPNDGLLYVPNGLITGIYLGRAGSLSLTKWIKINYKPPYGPLFDMSRFIHNPIEVIEILKEWKRYPYTHVYAVDSQGLYITEVYVDDSKTHYVLDPGLEFYYNHYYRVLLFINKKYIGPLIGPIDITNYLEKGLNEIALYVEWGTVNPVLRIYSHRVEGQWLIQRGVRGIHEEWFKDMSRCETISTELPIILSGLRNRVIWVKTRFTLREDPSSLYPKKLIVKSSGMRTLVFVNGNMIGRLYDDTPTRELYVHEPSLRNGVNEVILLCIITSSKSTLESIELIDAYRHVDKVLKLIFK